MVFPHLINQRSRLWFWNIRSPDPEYRAQPYGELRFTELVTLRPVIWTDITMRRMIP